MIDYYILYGYLKHLFHVEWCSCIVPSATFKRKAAGVMFISRMEDSNKDKCQAKYIGALVSRVDWRVVRVEWGGGVRNDYPPLYIPREINSYFAKLGVFISITVGSNINFCVALHHVLSGIPWLNLKKHANTNLYILFLGFTKWFESILYSSKVMFILAYPL
jgi:hypothetical protein